MLRERALAAAFRVPRVREIHNVNVVTLGGRTDLSLHLKLPADLPLEEAHAIASEVERAIVHSVPEVDAVQTHLEPLTDAAAGVEVRIDTRRIRELVEDNVGAPPRELRLLNTDDGVVAYVTLVLDPATPLA